MWYFLGRDPKRPFGLAPYVIIFALVHGEIYATVANNSDGHFRIFSYELRTSTTRK